MMMIPPNHFKPGGLIWFSSLLDELLEIRRRVGELISDELLASDLATERLWSDFAQLPRAARLKWIRAAKIEIDHRDAEQRVLEIIEQYEWEDQEAVAVLLDAFPKDIELRRELSVAERKLWCSRAHEAAHGRLTEYQLDVESAARIRLICGTEGQARSGIYFVTADREVVKIGFASNIELRIRTLQTGSARPLHLLLAIPGTPDDERALHKRFAALRLQGEWFRHDGDLKAFIEAEKQKSEDQEGG